MKKDLILFAGQSNMQGQTGVLPSPNEPVENAEEYLFLKDELTALKHPVGENVAFGGGAGKGELCDALLAAWQGCGSLAPYFCDSYCRSSGRRAVAVHAAKGSTTLSYWQKGGEPYRLLTEKFLCAAQKIGEENAGRRFAVFLQGESDALESRTKEEYARLLRAFGESLKADLGLEKFFVIRVGRFAQDERDFPVLAAQEEVCAGGGYFCMLTRKTGELTQNPRYMSYEPWHYNNEAFSLLGKICGENAAQIFEGKEIALENEPYAGFAAWLKAQK